MDGEGNIFDKFTPMYAWDPSLISQGYDQLQAMFLSISRVDNYFNILVSLSN